MSTPENVRKEEQSVPPEQDRWWQTSRRWLGRVASASGLAALGHVGGVVATSLAPADIETRLGTLSDTRATFHPMTVEMVTTLGDASFEFREQHSALWGVPFGIKTTPQISMHAINAAADSRSPLAFVQEQLSDPGLRQDVIDEASRELLAKRYAPGFFATLLLLQTLRRRDPHIRRRMMQAGVSATVAAGYLGVGAANSLPLQPSDAELTEGLAYIKNAANDIANLDKQDAAIGTYMLGFMQAIDNLHVETAGDKKPAIKVLFVSDIHSKPGVYEHIQSVVEHENVNLVIDTGDLIEFGFSAELRPDMVSGIRSLNVPYLFVKGNHDNDELMDYMASLQKTTLPNMLILGAKDQVRHYTYGGLSIAGVGDPRYFGDGNADVRDIEMQYSRAARQALGSDGKQLFDIIAAHNPDALSALASLARVNVSGHLHKASYKAGDTLEIHVGTTGAGGALYVPPAGKPAPPMSMTLVSFSANCAPTRIEEIGIANGNSTYSRTDLAVTKESDRTCQAPDRATQLPTLVATTSFGEAIEGERNSRGVNN